MPDHQKNSKPAFLVKRLPQPTWLSVALREYFYLFYVDRSPPGFEEFAVSLPREYGKLVFGMVGVREHLSYCPATKDYTVSEWLECQSTTSPSPIIHIIILIICTFFLTPHLPRGYK